MRKCMIVEWTWMFYPVIKNKNIYRSWLHYFIFIKSNVADIWGKWNHMYLMTCRVIIR